MAESLFEGDFYRTQMQRNSESSMERLDEEIKAYRENDSHCHSPIWIWFGKTSPEVSICLLCKQELRTKGSSSSLNTHLKRRHNDEQGYNAWKICEELLELKELRLSSKRQSEVWPKRVTTPHNKIKVPKIKGPHSANESLFSAKNENLEQQQQRQRLQYVEIGGFMEAGLDDIDDQEEDREEEPLAVKEELPADSSFAAEPFGEPRIEPLTSQNKPIRINVGGEVFTTSLETVTKFPDSHLGQMFNGIKTVIFDDSENQFFIDREGKHFRYILNFCRHGRLALPDDFKELDLLHEEAVFYEIETLVTAIERKVGRRTLAAAKI